MPQTNNSELMADLWASYQMTAYGRLLEEGDQNTECKRAFYAGGFQLIQLMTLLVTDEPGTDPNDTTLLEKVLDEIHAFFQAEKSIVEAMKH